MNQPESAQSASDKIDWLVTERVTIGDHEVAYDATIRDSDGHNQGSGVKRDSKVKRMIKRALWPALRARNQLLIDGFIEREVGLLIKRYLKEQRDECVFLEVGCGQLDLSDYLPRELWYNALDLELSEFHVRRHMSARERTNLVVASAARIPCADESASLIVSTETFEHIPEIDEALREVHRVARPDAVLICSIPNNYCHKYVKKGPHAGHVNDWSYQGFIDVMRERGFELVEGFMRGVWLPLPTWLTSTSYQLGISASDEHYNTNFFYVFRVKK